MVFMSGFRTQTVLFLSKPPFSDTKSTSVVPVTESLPLTQRRID